MALFAFSCSSSAFSRHCVWNLSTSYFVTQKTDVSLTGSELYSLRRSENKRSSRRLIFQSVRPVTQRHFFARPLARRPTSFFIISAASSKGESSGDSDRPFESKKSLAEKISDLEQYPEAGNEEESEDEDEDQPVDESEVGSEDEPRTPSRKRVAGRQLSKPKRREGVKKNCRSYAVAGAFRMRPLLKFLRQHYPNMRIRVYRDVIYARRTFPKIIMSNGRRVQVPDEEEGGDVFYFPYGVMVTWGLKRSQDVQVLEEVKQFQEDPVHRVELDSMEYLYGQSSRIRNDEIILPQDGPKILQETLADNPDRAWEGVVLTKLSHSHGMAQSVKLIVFEETVASTIRKTKDIPKMMAMTGDIQMSQKDMHKRVGEILVERHSINLHTDILDVPEFFWEYTELENLYSMTARYLDVEKRVEVLNKRLDIVRELFDLLSTELNHKYSVRLEWAIIFLIIIEVIISLIKDVFHLI